MEKKLYLVETVSMFRMRYVVEAYEEGHALDEVVMNIGQDDLKEFSQIHIDENIFSSRELSAKDFMELFEKDNGYLKDWDIAKKMSFINSIKYKE